MTLKPEHIRVNDIELANDIIWRMNETAQKQAETIRKLRRVLIPCLNKMDEVEEWACRTEKDYNEWDNIVTNARKVLEEQ